ncbi:flagellar filament capping protein FliD [Polynucleobacter sp. UK-FUSCHL-C3]|uniref:Flagellar hook-associated protein 2 n=1 Tax=Polynucleobacter sp. UK-FUSCHL-C3 TaxID=2955208 RepID=A0AAU8A1L0_9BURK
MAVSSTSSNSSVGTSSIDVATIVEQLMTVENKPLDKIKSQIEQKKLVISDLGTIKSKVATFQDALTVFQTPSTFNNSAASSSDSTVISATASNGAIKGNHSVTVNSLATATRNTVSGYTSSTASATVDATNGFAITVAGTTYNTNGNKTVSGVVTANAVTVLGASPSITDLKNWINGLGVNVSASVVETTGSSNWALMIQGTQTGTTNAISFTGLTGLTGATPALTNTPVAAAANASFIVNGTTFSRTSNTVTDVIDGLTLSLNKASVTAQTISVTKGADISSEAINTLIAAYNDVMSTHKSMTANSANSDKPGNFANSPSTLSFINQIKDSFAKGISYTSNGTLTTMSLSTLGIDLQLDGTAKFNSASFTTASAAGLRDTLALGVTMGYVSSTSNLNTFLTSQVKAGGALSSQITSETTAMQDLTKRKDNLQIRLNSIQNNLISQYSALNALLFQLSSTSNSLTSALDALTNSQKNN